MRKIRSHLNRMNEVGSDQPSSFRDPSGHLFNKDGVIFRQVNNRYKDNFDLLMESGLYSELVDSQLMIPHEETDIPTDLQDVAYKILRPQMVPFVSYPYEWSFSQLKDAALLTLEIQKRSLAHGMILKDASAYNIQFLQGRPVLIDTLSFEKYDEGQLWTAYRQFCQHFLAPLALMCYRDIRLSQLLRIHIDGIPLDLSSELLPWRTRMRLGLLAHLHLHARSEKKYETRQIDVREIRGVSKNSLVGLVESLRKAVTRLRWVPKGTEWAEYEKEMTYTDVSLEHKQKLVSKYLDMITPSDLWDMGANTGIFSRLASTKRIMTIALDVDPACVELNYLECKRSGDGRVLPLLVDFTNPSPGIGWSNNERFSLLERGPVEAVLALALVHHLAISNNVPMPMLASFFSSICRNLIIEFVPKSDSQVQRLLLSREDVFDEYTQESFEASFGRYFTIMDHAELTDSERVLFLMKRKED